jgi:2-polyprenyl-3-methyl-5-hydroxy-6-metoxy-1,4-benzoquinol methylase
MTYDERSWPMEMPGGGFTPDSVNPRVLLRSYRRMGNHWLRYKFASDRASGRRVLDVGCGYGVGSLIICDKAAEYVGADIDEGAVAWASNHLGDPKGRIRFRTLNELATAEQVHSFKLVISFEVVEHVSDPIGHLSMLERFAAPGATVLISTPNGRLSRHKRALFRTEFHVDEYNSDELLEMIPFKASSLSLYKQYRRDHLDSMLLRSRLHSHRVNSCQTDSKPEGESGQPHGERRIPGFAIAWKVLNDPLFWTYRRATVGEMRDPDYSTIIIEARL